MKLCGFSVGADFHFNHYVLLMYRFIMYHIVGTLYWHYIGELLVIHMRSNLST